MPGIWIVVPTYNEASNLPRLLKRLFLLALPLEVLVVDDASPDGTGQLADGLKNQYPHLHVLHRPMKQGLGSAYRAGFKYALEQGAEVVGEMDADLSHAPEDLPRLAVAIEQGADVAIGSRRVPGGQIVGWSWWRHFMSSGAMLVARLVLGLQTKDITSGFRLYTGGALDKIPWCEVKSNGYAWQEELIYLCEQVQLRVVEVPVIFTDRTQGSSKLKLSDIIEFFVTVVRLRLL